MKTLLSGLLACLLIAGPASAAVSVFDFNGDLNATTGPATMNLFNGAPFGTFGTDTINGQPATVYTFPAATPLQGLQVTHNAPPNGGGSYVNEYTLGYDIKFTNPSDYASFFQTNTSNANDGDLFRNATGGIGISGVYDGAMPANDWSRVMFVFDLANTAGPTLSKYINGALVGTQTLTDGVDGRWSLDPSFLLLTDNDGETNAGELNSFFFEDRALTAAEVRDMGGPTATGFAGTAPIPEPSSLTLLGLGALALIRRRKQA